MENLVFEHKREFQEVKYVEYYMSQVQLQESYGKQEKYARSKMVKLDKVLVKVGSQMKRSMLTSSQ